MKTDCITQIHACRDEFISYSAEQVLTARRIQVAQIKPSMVPTKAGVYIFYRLGETKPFHVGESINLQQRIYRNQLREQSNQSPMQRKVRKVTGLDSPELREYIRLNFEVAFLAFYRTHRSRGLYLSQVWDR